MARHFFSKDNPFRTSNISTLPFVWDHEKWGRLISRLESPIHGAIVGPHGSGKSTAFREIQKSFLKAGYEVKLLKLQNLKEMSHLSRMGRYLSLVFQILTIPRSTKLMIDSIEQLSRLEWVLLKLLILRIPTLVVTSHTDGFLPTMYECFPQFELFQRFASTLDPNVQEIISPATLDEIYQSKNKNMRDSFLELYDIYASK